MSTPSPLTAHASQPVRIALAGNPNTGKTSVFNRLTGASARVGNYAGVTVEREIGLWTLPSRTVEVMDVPGAYSLAARSAEEQVAIRTVFGLDPGEPRPALVVVVIDATQLVRNLYFAMQLIEARVPVVLALNLMDVARAQGTAPDPERVADILGVPVVPVSAHTGEGMKALASAVERVLVQPDEGRSVVPWRYPKALQADVDTLAGMVTAWSPEEAKAMGRWALLSVDVEDELVDVPEHVRTAVAQIRSKAESEGRDIDTELIGSRYSWLDLQDFGIAANRPDAGLTLTHRIDAWLLHPFFGALTFLFAMGVLFQALFSWSDPAIGAIEQLFSWVGMQVQAALPEGLLNDFLVQGVLNGMGSVLVFLPQILLLFFLLGFLEDCGYMARVAFIVDRGMKSLGLHGRAFVPMLSGYACAVPAIMATRTLERQRDRLLTMMVVPLMSCSARLPVYTLIISALFLPDTKILGFLPAPGFMMVFMYVFSTLMALIAAAVLGRTLLKGPKVPLLLELPPYRLPRLATVLRQMWMRARTFLTEAGTTILVCTIVLWGLLAFPQHPVLSEDYAAQRSALPATETEALAHIDAAERAEILERSYGGRLGKQIEPLIAPLGFDWKIGVGLVGAFAAREVFVSTMGVVYGIGDAVDESSTPLRERIRDERRPDGTPVYTPLVGLSLMVFFALSAQCMSTLAVVRRESHSWRWPIFLFTYMTVLAWVASFAVYQGGKLLGL